MVEADRAGSEHEVGATTSFATPTDRVLGTVWGGYYRADWTFSGFHEGDIRIRGEHAGFRLSFQTSSTLSIQWRMNGRLEQWDNRRLGDDGVDFVGEETDRRVVTIDGDLGFTFWFEGRLGFAVALGGGFQSEPPVLYRPPNGAVPKGDRGFGRLGMGVVSRF